jgi:hypothetical protein
LASATSGLENGQTIGIAATGFSPNATLTILECDGNAQPNCDPSTARLVPAPAGSFFGQYPDAPGAPGLSREILVPSGLIDCAAQACVLEVQNAGEPTQVAPPVRIAFDPTVPPPVAPAGSVNMNSQPLTVTGSGFNPNALVEVIECASNPHSVTNCDPSTEMGVASSATGGFNLPYAKEKQVISVSQGNVNCSQAGACVLSVTNVFRNAQGTLLPITLASAG